MTVFEQLAAGYEAFRRLKKLPYNHNAVTLYYNFLGLNGKDPEIHEEALRKIELLKSPHAKTMMKIYEVQHAED